MQRREQYLLGFLLTAVIIWQMGGWVVSFVVSPFEERSKTLGDLKKSVADKSDKKLALVRAEKQLRDWKAKSLPPDDLGKSKLPTALDSARSYLKWLTDLAQLCGFESLNITPAPGGQTPKDNVYISVVVKIDAKARYDQLARFLDLFYRTQLMHRISAMSLIANVSEGEQVLSVKLDAEGLVLIDSQPRRTLFPQTELIEPLSEDATTVQIANFEEFPKEAGFRIRIKGEFLKVTQSDGRKWTVERGVEQTPPASYPKETQVELVKLDPQQAEQSIEEFRTMIATNIFLKPAPPYRLKLESLTEKVVTRGKSFEFAIAARDYDKVQGRPEFTVVGNPPAGLRVDRYGKVTWNPGQEIASGKYVVGFEVRHPSVENGVLTDSFTVRLRDAKLSPQLATSNLPRVYLNREWKFRPQLTNLDSDKDLYTWKLGDNPPPGMTIDAKTGELKWIPGDASPVGEISIPLVVADSDTPPQTTTLSLKIDLLDDAAQFTRLTGILTIGANKRAFLFDQSTDKKTELHEGDPFAISDISGTVKLIAKNHIVMTLGQRDLRLEIGESLREAHERVKDN